MEVIEQFGVYQGQVLVSPCGILHVRRDLLEPRLQSSVSLVVRSAGGSCDRLASCQELIPMPLGDRDRFACGDVARSRAASLRCPAPRFGPLVDAELESASSRNTAEERRELLIILELEPVHHRIPAPVSMHALQ